MNTILERALENLNSVVAHVRPEHFEHPTPCTEWSVAQVVEHALLDQQIWAHGIDGQPLPTGDAFAPTGALDPDLPAQAESVVHRVRAAWSTVTVGDAVNSPLPQGKLPADTAARAAALDAAIHTWDVAIAIGVPSGLDDALAADLLPTARELVEPLRQWGA